MKRTPGSFVVFGERGKYRVWCNPESGYWYAMQGSGRERQRVSLGVRTRPEAEAKVREIDRPAPIPSAPQPKRMTWQQYADAFLAFKIDGGLAESSGKRYRAGLDAFGRYLKDKGLVFVNDVTLLTLEGYPPYRCKQEKCSVKTSYGESLTLKGAFKWGSRASRGLLASNPAVEWETKEPVTPKRPCYTEEEVARLETGVRPWLRPIVTVLAWTGLRIGELIELPWKDVDLKTRVLHVRIRDDWKPKGRRDRVVPIFPKVEAVLRQQRIGEFVFTGPRGGRLTESHVLDFLHADQRKLGLPEKDVHGFRRFFATHMMTKCKVDAETVRQWGGWKSLETMLRYLADVDVRDTVAAMEQAVRQLAAS